MTRKKFYRKVFLDNILDIPANILMTAAFTILGVLINWRLIMDSFLEPVERVNDFDLLQTIVLFILGIICVVLGITGIFNSLNEVRIHKVSSNEVLKRKWVIIENALGEKIYREEENYAKTAISTGHWLIKTGDLLIFLDDNHYYYNIQVLNLGLKGFVDFGANKKFNKEFKRKIETEIKKTFINNR